MYNGLLLACGVVRIDVEYGNERSNLLMQGF